MREKLKTEQLQKLAIPENEVVWMDDHEIWVNEHMFDIHSSKLENGVYHFTGLYDEAETELVKAHRETEGKDNDDDKALTQIFKLVLFNYREKTNDLSERPVMQYSYLPYDIDIHHAPFDNVPTPPPRDSYYIHVLH
jgi:hypothetical protein